MKEINWPEWLPAAFTDKGIEKLELVYAFAKQRSLFHRASRVSAEDLALSAWGAWRALGRWDLITEIE